MRHFSHVCAAAFGCMFMSLAVGSAHAQSGGDLEITKQVVAPGQLVTGGDFVIAGTAGQHDAGIVLGATFTVYGGFHAPTGTVDPPSSSAVIAYLLGITSDPTGLDGNADGTVDVADYLIWRQAEPGINPGPLDDRTFILLD